MIWFYWFVLLFVTLLLYFIIYDIRYMYYFDITLLYVLFSISFTLFYFLIHWHQCGQYLIVYQMGLNNSLQTEQGYLHLVKTILTCDKLSRKVQEIAPSI